MGTIGAIAAILGVSALSVYRWLRGRAFFVIRHDPTRPVKSKITYADVSAGVDVLVERARHFGPDVVIGINRGGAIVGGLICKALGHPFVEVIKVNCDQTPAIVGFQYGMPLEGRVLITDDACRKGEHMREAVNYVRSQDGVTEVRTSVLLQLRLKHAGPEIRAFRGPGADLAAYFTNDASVTLPWDP